MTLAELYFSPSGRIGRQTWWLYFLVPTLVLSWGIATLDRFFGVGGVLLGVWYLVIFWPSIAVTMKRWHDSDWSGWWLLVLLVPILGALWNFVQCGFLPGSAGTNRFGPEPLV